MKRLLVAILLLFSGLAAFSQATQVDAVKLVKNGPAGYYYRANAGGTANEWASPATARADLNYWTESGGNVSRGSGNVEIAAGNLIFPSAAMQYVRNNLGVDVIGITPGYSNTQVVFPRGAAVYTAGTTSRALTISAIAGYVTSTDIFSVSSSTGTNWLSYSVDKGFNTGSLTPIKFSPQGYETMIISANASGSGYIGIGTSPTDNKVEIFTTSTANNTAGLSVSATGAQSAYGYGGLFSKTGAGLINIGLQASASGGTYNWSARFPQTVVVGSLANLPAGILSVSQDGGSLNGYSQGANVLSLMNANNGANAAVSFGYYVGFEQIANMQAVRRGFGGNGAGVGSLKIYAQNYNVSPFFFQMWAAGASLGLPENTPPSEAFHMYGNFRASGTLISDALIGTANRLPYATSTGALGFADASITTSSTQVDIAAQGTRNMRIGAGGNTILATGTDRNLEVRDDGSIQLHGGLTADPSSPNVAAFWWNSTSTRAKYRKDGSTNRTIANLEDDILGLADAIVASTHTPGGTTRLVRYDGNANAVTATLGVDLEEYQKYTFPCTRNATNAVTFSAASGYSFRESGNPTLFTTSLTAAAHTTYVAQRVGTVIYIGKL